MKVNDGEAEAELMWGGSDEDYDQVVMAIDVWSGCGNCSVNLSLEVCGAHALLDSQSGLDVLFSILRLS